MNHLSLVPASKLVSYRNSQEYSEKCLARMRFALDVCARHELYASQTGGSVRRAAELRVSWVWAKVAVYWLDRAVQHHF